MMLKDSEIMVVNLSPIMKIIPKNCGPCCCAVHEEASEADVVDMILHNGVNVTVCVDVSITVDTTGCGNIFSLKYVHNLVNVTCFTHKSNSSISTNVTVDTINNTVCEMCLISSTVEVISEYSWCVYSTKTNYTSL